MGSEGDWHKFDHPIERLGVDFGSMPLGTGQLADTTTTTACTTVRDLGRHLGGGCLARWVGVWEAELDSWLPLSIPVVWNGRPTGRGGRCTMIRGGDVERIELHPALIPFPIDLLEMFAHELAHASAHIQSPWINHYHGANWLRWARLLGARPEVCSNIPALTALRETRARWVAECIRCGKQSYRIKKPKQGLYVHRGGCNGLFGPWEEKDQT